jgi:hypothetical protein
VGISDSDLVLSSKRHQTSQKDGISLVNWDIIKWRFLGVGLRQCDEDRGDGNGSSLGIIRREKAVGGK